MKLNLWQRIAIISVSVFIGLWVWTGTTVLMHLAGMENCPQEIIAIEGTCWSRIMFYLIPLLFGVAVTLFGVGMAFPEYSAYASKEHTP